jgi:hypothetical protein
MATGVQALDDAIAASAEAKVKADLTTLIAAISVFTSKYTEIGEALDSTLAAAVDTALGIIGTSINTNDVIPAAVDIYDDGSFPAALKAEYVSRLETAVLGADGLVALLASVEDDVDIIMSEPA